jgi:hypothetical protein
MLGSPRQLAFRFDLRYRSDMARPTSFTPEIAEEICARLSAGASLMEVARDKNMPCVSTITRWVVEDRGGFYQDYMKARQCQAHVVADELLGLIDGLTRNIPDGAGGMPMVLARKEQLANIRWFLSKVLREQYGDQVRVEHAHHAQVVVYLPELHSPTAPELLEDGTDETPYRKPALP